MRVAVTVDDREPAAVREAVRSHPDVIEVGVERLSAGDLAIDSVGFERKTLRDYVNGVMGRSGPDLREQAERMAAGYDHAYVLLEADFRSVESMRTGISPAAIYGSMASITARQGTPVVPCTDRRRLVDYAIRLGRKHAEDPSTRPPPVSSVPARYEPTAKRMYACIEGIGPELADALYEAFPTVAELVAANRAELTAVEGIGETRARAIQTALRDRPIDAD
ncbi:helix-hairpin-helix domain-containing protein [Salinilacihabitans rarus]|uniref:helix-hairpin-helix domain-containing protein n=1 Tax=Salinilacihabitans rarus TaxID=2961596 RepID=UPI0020C8B5B5|nr:helix-hairpin-helix domain-containing protein [Salinilacihabitans rarus]